MNVIVSATPDEVAQKVHLKLQELSFQSIYIPAGTTPLPLYALWEAHKPSYLNGKKLIPVDEVTTGSKTGLFQKFYQKHLPSFLNLLNPLTNFKQADIAILGVGLNGHVAFHEPEVPFDFSYGKVNLSESTCKELQVEIGTQGFSYGLAPILKCKTVILIVTGAKKAEILNQTLLGDDETLPVSQLKSHSDLWIFADQAACF